MNHDHSDDGISIQSTDPWPICQHLALPSVFIPFLTVANNCSWHQQATVRFHDLALYKSTLKGVYTMTIGTQTGMQTRCDDRFANRSSCVNSQIHCFQTGRPWDRKNQTFLRSDRRHARCVNALAIGMTTGLQTYAKYLAAHWLTISMVLTARVDFTKYICKKLWFIHELTAHHTSKTAKITKRWLPTSTSPKCQCADE